MTSRYIELRACERFGIDPQRMGTMATELVTELLVFELVRQQEEGRAGEE